MSAVVPLRRMLDAINGDWPRYSVTGPRGAVNLTFLPPFPGFNRWRGADFGRHSPRPMYEGEEPFGESCELLGEVACHYDGSSLRADGYVHLHEAGDTDAIYAVLEAEYADLFGGDS